MSPRAAPVVLALLVASCGGSAAAPDPSVAAATKVAACVTAHGMSAPNDRVDPPQPTIRGESTTIFRSCEWPPPAYAATEGYTEIRVTRVPWPEKAEVTGERARSRRVAVRVGRASVHVRKTSAAGASGSGALHRRHAGAHHRPAVHRLIAVPVRADRRRGGAQPQLLDRRGALRALDQSDRDSASSGAAQTTAVTQSASRSDRATTVPSSQRRALMP